MVKITTVKPFPHEYAYILRPFGASHGIEPVFPKKYQRRIKPNDQTGAPNLNVR